MYKAKVNKKELRYVIDNLCIDTTAELIKMFGDNYKEIVFGEIEQLATSNICLIKLKSTGEAVGTFGLIPQGHSSAGIFLLTTNKLHNGNVITFLRSAKAQIEQWLNEYDLIMDYCYKKNLTIQKWLRLLGFKPSEYQDNDFQVYYKGNIGLYNE